MLSEGFWRTGNLHFIVKITCFRKLFHKKSESMYIKEDCSDSSDDWLLQPQTTNHGAHTSNPGLQLQRCAPGQWAVHCHVDVWKHRHCGHRLVSYAHMTLTGGLCTSDIGWWVMHTWHWLVTSVHVTLVDELCTHDTDWWLMDTWHWLMSYAHVILMSELLCITFVDE